MARVSSYVAKGIMRDVRHLCYVMRGSCRGYTYAIYSVWISAYGCYTLHDQVPSLGYFMYTFFYLVQVVHAVTAVTSVSGADRPVISTSVVYMTHAVIMQCYSYIATFDK